LSHGFRGLSSWSLNFIASGAAHGKAENQDREYVIRQSFSHHGSQETERQTLEESRDKINFLKGTLQQYTSFNQVLPSTVSTTPNSPFSYEPINGLIY
jgi:hypothetical protein